MIPKSIFNKCLRLYRVIMQVFVDNKLITVNEVARIENKIRKKYKD